MMASASGKGRRTPRSKHWVKSRSRVCEIGCNGQEQVAERDEEVKKGDWSDMVRQEWKDFSPNMEPVRLNHELLALAFLRRANFSSFPVEKTRPIEGDFDRADLDKMLLRASALSG